MNEDKKISIRPNQEIYEKSATYIIDHFTHYLLDSAKEGYLPGIAPKVIEVLAKDFAKEHKTHLVNYLGDSINTHLEWRERDLCSKMRQRPFDRLLVKRFSKWFPKHGALVAGETELFSRRMLPGLLKSLEMMAGAEQQKVMEKAVSAYWDEIEFQKAEMADWSDLYRHVKANEAIDTYLAHISLSFKGFDDRLDWFIRSINNGLGQSDKYAFEGEGVWVWILSEKGALKLLRTLYSPISRRVHDAAKRTAFEKDLEPRFVHQTYALLDQLAARKEN